MPRSGRLSGRVALVTGSSRNLGRAVALALAADGADVAAHGYTDRAGAEATAEASLALGVRASAVSADIGDPAQVHAMVAQVERELGPVDILVSCPGYRPKNNPLAISPEEWRRVLATNLDGPWFCAQAVLGGMAERGWGRVINVAGTGAWLGEERAPHVAASKSGLVGLTRALARDYAHAGVLVNLVSPGLLHTEESPYRIPGRDYKAFAAKMPTGRVTTPEDVAGAIVYLCLPEQRAITGQTLHVNSGTYFG
ncbi:MAG: SDR family oxidoreductase [Chloroflexota bacterium]